MNVKEIAQRNTAWNLQDAIDHLTANPHDPCLQYIALVLAARENDFGPELNAFDRIQTLLSLNNTTNRSADLLSVFGGTAAVQESLQLDVMLQAQESG